MIDIFKLNRRVQDGFGKGHWGARRGISTHKGVDLICRPHELVKAPITGIITKHGTVYPEPRRSEFRYVEITHKSGWKVRLHYVTTGAGAGDLAVGGYMQKGKVCGITQDIGGFYTNGKKKMLNHIHFEVWNKKNKRVDPNQFLMIGA